MDAATWYEIIGYVGSALIVASLAMRSLLRLRIINLIGALVFTVYGLLIAAPPVWVVNLVIVGIDAWQLRHMLGRNEDLEVVEVRPDNAYLTRFLDYHAEEIERFVPTFDGVRSDHRPFFVLRDLVPAAVVLLRPVGNHEAAVDLDYAIPAYRDYTSGQYVYGEGLAETLDVDHLVTDPGSDAHRPYLARMGFEPEPDGDRWRLDL